MPTHFRLTKRNLILTGLILWIVSIAVILAAVAILTSSRQTAGQSPRAFASCTEMAAWVNAQRDNRQIYPIPGVDLGNDGRGETPSAGGGTGAPAYSRTNVQVAGVDEADITKTDGKYVYSLSPAQTEVIVTDVQQRQMRVVSRIELDGAATELFLLNGKLVVLGRPDKVYPAYAEDFGRGSIPYYGGSQTYVAIFNVTDPAKPLQERAMLLDGNYQTARAVDGRVYVVNTYNYPYYWYVGNITAEGVQKLLPHIAEVQGTDSPITAKMQPLVDCNQVEYYGQGSSLVFSTVLAIDVGSNTSRGEKVMLGNAQQIYMSAQNLYIANVEYDTSTSPSRGNSCDWLDTLLRGCVTVTDIVPPTDIEPPHTLVHKFAVSGLDVTYKASGKVNGTVLNQFSMDEHSGYFRIATTVGSWVGGDAFVQQGNSIFVLDTEMKQVGSVEGLAPSEQIYAVRYVGDRAYMVTFRQVDPLYVIDLSNPQSPKVLGELKIPGFSNYLHPYDENRIIGFGRDVDARTGRQGGVQMALFDVSDPANPRQISKVVLGDAYATAPILNTHKALLFDRERNLLVVPILRTQDPRLYDTASSQRTDFVVYSITADEIKERKTITVLQPSREGYVDPTRLRSMYIGETLYTYWVYGLQSFNLTSLEFISKLNLVER